MTPIAPQDSGIQNPSVIDLVGRDPQLGSFVLYMFEHREWSSDPKQLEQLREKVNAYLYYVISGQLGHDYPETRGRPVHFNLRCLHAPDAASSEYLTHLQERLREHEIKFVVSVSDVLAPPQ